MVLDLKRKRESLCSSPLEKIGGKAIAPLNRMPLHSPHYLPYLSLLIGFDDEEELKRDMHYSKDCR